MLFGYSHGGGLAAYTNFAHAAIVTKSVAIDFHPYHNSPTNTEYLQGLVSPVGSGMAMNIYYSCHSDWYWLEQITYGATTFQYEAGIPSGSYVHDGSYAFNNAAYNTWTWTGSTGKYLKLRIVGLSNTGLPNSCGCSPGQGSGYPAILFGCSLNQQYCSLGPGAGSQNCASGSGISHSDMPYKVDIEMEVCEWVGGCPPAPPPTSPPAPAWDTHTCANPDMPEGFCCPRDPQSGMWTTCRYPRYPYTEVVNGQEVMVVNPEMMSIKQSKFCLTAGDMPMDPVQLPGWWGKFGLCPQDYAREATHKLKSAPEPPPKKSKDAAKFAKEISKIEENDWVSSKSQRFPEPKFNREFDSRSVMPMEQMPMGKK
jgi:hypothetical protein